MSVTTGYLLFCIACVLYAAIRIKWFDGPGKSISAQTLIGARARIVCEAQKRAPAKTTEAEARPKLMHYRRDSDPTVWWGFVDPDNLAPGVTLMADQEACSRAWALKAIRKVAPELLANNDIQDNGYGKEKKHGA